MFLKVIITIYQIVEYNQHTSKNDLYNVHKPSFPILNPQ